MTFNIELEEDEIIRVIYELRIAANDYMIDGKHYDSTKCLHLSHRVEMQYRAQQECDDQDSQKDPID